MSSFEFNKVFAAFLCALISVYLIGFFVDKATYKKELKEDVVTIEGAVASSHGSAPKVEPTAEPILALLETADLEKGKKITKACVACHSFDKGGPVKQGPNLWNIVMADKAAVSGFDYSQALIDKGGKWDYESLNQFMWKPKKYVKGTKMNFIGLKKPNDRAAIIAWLREQADTPAPLPTQEEISAQQPKEEEHSEEEHSQEGQVEEQTTEEAQPEEQVPTSENEPAVEQSDTPTPNENNEVKEEETEDKTGDAEEDPVIEEEKTKTNPTE